MKCEFDIKETMGLKDYLIKYYSNSFFGYLRNVKAEIKCNGVKINLNDTVNKDSHIKICYTPIKQVGNPSDLSIDIVYEDDDCIVINKEAGVPCIPSRLHQHDTLFNRLQYYFKDSESTIHFISRLDKDTSGLVLVCKNQFAACLFSKVSDKFIKVYHADTFHPLPFKSGEINLPIKRISGMKRGVVNDGKLAKTTYAIARKKDGVYSYLVRIYTGVTHQIRVHMAYFNSPIINDCLYNNKVCDGPMHLHACYLKFYHPLKLKWIEVKSKPNFANK